MGRDEKQSQKKKKKNRAKAPNVGMINISTPLSNNGFNCFLLTFCMKSHVELLMSLIVNLIVLKDKTAGSIFAQKILLASIREEPLL